MRTDDYARAEKVLDYNLRGTVRNARLEPHWLPDGDACWYKLQTDQGVEYVAVDPAGKRTPLFDHGRLAEALAAAAPPAKVDALHLEVLAVESSGGHRKASVRVSPDLSAVCDLDTYRCEVTTHLPINPEPLLSPSGKQAVVVHGNDLWLADPGGGQERRLTQDGEAYFAYGKTPDTSLATLPLLRKPTPRVPVDVSWAPDEKTLVVQLKDERAIASYIFVESVPQDGSFRPKEYQLRLPLPGDVDTPAPIELAVIDAATAQKKVVALPLGWAPISKVLAWTGDGRFFLAAASFDHRQTRLLEVDADSGKARTIIEEKAETPLWLNEFVYNPDNLRVLGGGSEVLWFSERDGWGHLYLYDVKTASLVRQVTHGNWLVRDLIEVDEAKRELYFTASGREPGWDPYYRALYRVSLDGGEPVLLTPEKAEHEFDPAVPPGVAAHFGADPSPSSIAPDGR